MAIIQDRKTGAYLVDVMLAKQHVLLAETPDQALQFFEREVDSCADSLRRFFPRYDWQVIPCQ